MARFIDALRRFFTVPPRPPDDDPPMPNEEIIRLYFAPKPIEPETKAAFASLAERLLEHLDSPAREKEFKRLISKLRAGVEPVEALSEWFMRSSSPRKPALGTIALDWQAREEVEWQAKRLIRAHKLSVDWSYDADADRSWENWREENRCPVDYPLDGLAVALASANYKLIRCSGGDDGLFAFAIPADSETTVMHQLNVLGIEVDA